MTKEINYLGLLINDQMTWTKHIDKLCLKLSSSLYALRRTHGTTTLDSTKIAYYALFESKLRYGLASWGSSSESNLVKVLRLQKKTIRIMAELKPRDSCRDDFKTLKMLAVTSLYVLETIIYCLTKHLTRHQDVHNRQTRKAQNFSLPPHRSAVFENKPTYIGMKLFNALPEDKEKPIKLQENENVFKKLAPTKNSIYTRGVLLLITTSLIMYNMYL